MQRVVSWVCSVVVKKKSKGGDCMNRIKSYFGKRKLKSIRAKRKEPFANLSRQERRAGLGGVGLGYKVHKDW
jgi:hypothetical protein